MDTENTRPGFLQRLERLGMAGAAAAGTLGMPSQAGADGGAGAREKNILYYVAKEQGPSSNYPVSDGERGIVRELHSIVTANRMAPSYYQQGLSGNSYGDHNMPKGDMVKRLQHSYDHAGSSWEVLLRDVRGSNPKLLFNPDLTAWEDVSAVTGSKFDEKAKIGDTFVAAYREGNDVVFTKLNGYSLVCYRLSDKELQKIAPWMFAADVIDGETFVKEHVSSEKKQKAKDNALFVHPIPAVPFIPPEAQTVVYGVGGAAVGVAALSGAYALGKRRRRKPGEPEAEASQEPGASSPSR